MYNQRPKNLSLKILQNLRRAIKSIILVSTLVSAQGCSTLLELDRQILGIDHNNPQHQRQIQYFAQGVLDASNETQSYYEQSAAIQRSQALEYERLRLEREQLEALRRLQTPSNPYRTTYGN